MSDQNKQFIDKSTSNGFGFKAASKPPISPNAPKSAPLPPKSVDVAKGARAAATPPPVIKK